MKFIWILIKVMCFGFMVKLGFSLGFWVKFGVLGLWCNTSCNVKGFSMSPMKPQILPPHGASATKGATATKHRHAQCNCAPYRQIVLLT